MAVLRIRDEEVNLVVKMTDGEANVLRQTLGQMLAGGGTWVGYGTVPHQWFRWVGPRASVVLEVSDYLDFETSEEWKATQELMLEQQMLFLFDLAVDVL